MFMAGRKESRAKDDTISSWLTCRKCYSFRACCMAPGLHHDVRPDCPISLPSPLTSPLSDMPSRVQSHKHTQGPYILDISFFVRFHCVMAMTTALGTGGLRFKSNSCCGVSAACYSFHSQRNDSFSKCVYNKCFQ